MITLFPQAIPEIPVANVDKAAEYYVRVLGFSFDWGTAGPVTIWLNLNNKTEVNELFERWKQAGANVIEAPEDKPWHLREFRVADLDGNQLRVFYDFAWELKQQSV